MELTLIFLSVCLLSGSAATLLAFNPQWYTELRPFIPWLLLGRHRSASNSPSFSLHNTLLLIGPAVNHQSCRIQRKLIKSAVPHLICEDIAIMEIYGENPPRRNGEILTWLDPSLLRLALHTEDGFFIIFINNSGKTVFRNQAPMLADTLFEKLGLNITLHDHPSKRQSDILRRLKAA